MQVYTEDYLKSYDVIDETFYDAGGKKERDQLAKKLRKDGYKVKTTKFSFPDFGTKTQYNLHATKRKGTFEFEQNIEGLKNEFISLKKEIFGECKFVVMDDQDPKTKRYNQLLGFFYPCYRTKDWINPYQGSEKL